MTEKFKILAKYVKDLSSEPPDIETFLFVKENISKYQLNIDITSKAIKNKLIEINTTLKFEDKEPNEKKSYYEIVYATIIKVNDEKINAVAENDVDRTSDEGKASSVQFLHFNFSDEQIKKFKHLDTQVLISINHGLYDLTVKISNDTKSSLLKDFN